MGKIKFSIILPTYNVQDFIAQALNSCINQTFKDIEIIVVDDCGQDKSIEIAKEFALKDERVKIVYNKENLKLFHARIEGAKIAQGEYLLHLDPDDYLDEKACERLFEILEQNKDFKLDFIMFNFYQQDEKYHFSKQNIITKNKLLTRQEFQKIYFNKEGYYNIWSKCIKKEIYLKAINTLAVSHKFTVAEDILACMGILLMSDRIYLLNEHLYYYCYNPKSSRDLTKIPQANKDCEFVQNELAKLALKGDDDYHAFIQTLILILKTHNAKRSYDYSVWRYPYFKFVHRFILSLKKRYLNFFRKKIVRKSGF
ncbi:glycosyltransferase family 2 protein [Campylobacter sp. MIT 12-8780]|uniref:glycosyltransferase family 2 protein n=1 Tax=unclassified Campylobacter TaxID=2593542 RepID=UPI00115DF685|nr:MULTISPECIES: glycosyltransferase family 2 protein [unclassified Campylobacter]NDJ26778.1 glycosyltransferase family 2 protein [Campylobacter sp. MIT 19-121]TQR42398.1 glycosyltransferase family 2 protein [Campylobacter sp. MIT 12-8780]